MRLMRPAALGRATLVLLYGGVAPLEPPTDPCLKAPIHAAPATEEEWVRATFNIEDLRVRRRDGHWIDLRDARWSSDALLGRGKLAKELEPSSDSLAIAWTEIERIEHPTGRQIAEGATIGAIVGLGVGVVAILAEDHEPCGDTFCMSLAGLALLFTVPIGAAVGACAGAAVRSWTPFYCAPSAPDAPEP